eukprot:scaffold199459_cov30-Tisochrysis_lutea.AAC.2
MSPLFVSQFPCTPGTGKMLVGAVPNQGSAAERAGIEYGDEVSLKRAYTMVSDPVSWKIIAKDDGSKVSRIILDMRGNGGGVLDAAIGIAGLFSEKPLVLFVTDAGGAKQPLYSREPEVLARQPLQVWVNSRTASSAEVLAAALKDNCRARVVGTKTFGKGVIQVRTLDIVAY